MSKKMDWFRLYPEIRRDPKIRRLSPEERWLWISILCIASDSPERGKLLISEDLPYELEDIADESGMDVESVDIGLKKLVALRLMGFEDGVYYLPKWEQRQYDNPSDTPQAARERKRKSREKKKEFDAQSQESHDNVTSCHDIEAEADNRIQNINNTATIAPAHEEDSIKLSTTPKQEYESFYAAHERVWGFECNPMQAEKLKSYIDQDGMNETVVIRAMERAALNGAGYSFRLIEKILNDYLKSKALTLTQAIAIDNEFDKRRKATNATHREKPRGHPSPSGKEEIGNGSYYDQFPGLVQNV